MVPELSVFLFLMHMNLFEHYDELYKTSIDLVKKTNFTIDDYIENPLDKRFGITLLIRPNKASLNYIQDFLNELKAIDPTQYYYPNSDIHITVASIISCYAGFNLSQIKPSDYIEIINNSLENFQSFKIKLNGITASESGIMLQGYYNKGTLDLLRDKLRQNFRNSNLEQSIDKRYELITAHSTVVRFRNEVKEKEQFIEILEAYRDKNFGQFEVSELELVYNDWYQRKEKVHLLKVFRL